MWAVAECSDRERQEDDAPSGGNRHQGLACGAPRRQSHAYLPVPMPRRPPGRTVRQSHNVVRKGAKSTRRLSGSARSRVAAAVQFSRPVPAVFRAPIKGSARPKPNEQQRPKATATQPEVRSVAVRFPAPFREGDAPDRVPTPEQALENENETEPDDEVTHGRIRSRDVMRPSMRVNCFGARPAGSLKYLKNGLSGEAQGVCRRTSWPSRTPASNDRTRRNRRPCCRPRRRCGCVPHRPGRAVLHSCVSHLP